MNKFLKYVAAIAILIAIPAIIQRVAFGESKSDVAKQMRDFASQANKDLPRKIDKVTTLTKVDFDAATSTYRIYYTMDSGINIDQAKKGAFHAFAVKQICGGDMKRILAKKVAIEYLYTYNPDGEDQKMSLLIPPASCA